MENVCIVLTGIYLVIMAVIDRRTKKIPVIPGVVCMGMVSLLQIVDGKEPGAWVPGIFVGIMLYMVSRISRGKIGSGDALVYVVTGLVLGFARNLELLLFSLLMASFVALLLVVVRRVGRNYAIPFVPFTAVAFGMVVCL